MFQRVQRFSTLLVLFGWRQALSCIFPVIIFLTLAASKVIQIPGLPRYDFILLVCILAQIMMIYGKLETWDELKVICMFHLIGIVLEIYKVHIGSWSYPEFAYLKVLDVPLYSGFMYASVASYICQAWRRLDLRFEGWPPAWLAYVLCAFIYGNFFTNHFMYDVRWLIILLLFVIFRKTKVYFRVREQLFSLHIIVSFVLIGFFIWIAENISTFFGAWTYPHQADGWNLVHWGKISSWFLLVIISVVLVVELKKVKSKKQPVH